MKHRAIVYLITFFLLIGCKNAYEREYIIVRSIEKNRSFFVKALNCTYLVKTEAGTAFYTSYHYKIGDTINRK